MESVKIKVSVRNHRITADVPPEVPDGEAEAVIHYKPAAAPGPEAARRRHLQALFDEIERSGEAKLTREEIDRLVAHERAAWGD